MDNGAINREGIFHKDVDFPVIHHYDRLGSRSYPNLLTHWHEEVELLYFKKGSANLICNQISSQVTVGELAFISPYCFHRIENVTDICEYHCLVINPDFINNVPYPVMNSSQPILTGNPQAIACVSKIIEEIEQKDDWYQTMIKGEFLALIAHLSRITQPSSVCTKNHIKQFNSIRLAMEYIHNHFNEPITIQDICGVVNLSKTYFSQCFLKVTGKTIIDYINHYRCEHAYHLIQTGKYSIGECGEMSGFNNMSYFTKKFRQQYGALPSQITRKHK